jgi:5-methylcytosine-specific restriction endonuclease McrA
MGRALVLNASDSPLAVVAARRAVVLVLKEKAEVVASNGMIFRSERISIEAPSIVRLRRYVRIPYRPHAPLTRRAVFARDDWSCQYCGAAAENLDHVVPRSRGGTHTWDNVVASCRRCNARKENKTPVEAGFRLVRTPFAPTDGFRLTLGHLEPGWEAYRLSAGPRPGCLRRPEIPFRRA